MKMVIVALFCLASISVIGQKNKVKADKAYAHLEYSKAISLYEKYLSRKSDKEASIKLANCYQFTNQFNKAEDAFSNLYNTYNDDSDIHFNYAELLLINGNTKLSKEIVELYIKNNPNDTRANILLKSCNMADDFMKNVDKFEIKKPSFNSNVSDYAPMYMGDQLLYTTQKNGKTDLWSGRSFSNIYVTNSRLEDAQPLEGDLNGKFHNGAGSFQNNTTLYYTRNNTKKGKERDYNLLIAIAKRVNNRWSFNHYFEYNNKDYNLAYPSLNDKGSILIFSSDMPGGMGNMDLYISKMENGSWTNPVNMKDINTIGDDVFPYQSSDGTIYFASNGLPGLGGLDIYSKNLNDNMEPQNLGAPINSNRDDFGFITKDLQSGYLSSNRGSQDGTDNIYLFQHRVQPIVISGIVLDKWTNIPLKETKVKLQNEVTGKTSHTITSDDGRFNFEAQSGAQYYLVGEKNYISTTSESIKTNASNSDVKYYYKLLHNDPRFSLEGYVQNQKDKSGIMDVAVKRLNISSLEETTKLSTEEGFFKFQLDQHSDFEISGLKDGYYTQVSEASTKGLDRSSTLYVKLFLSIEEIIIGKTKVLGKEKIGGWEFENIYYDLDKYFIRADAALALDKVVEFLIVNPTLKIELGAHTDSRGGDDYNLELSQNRASAAANHLIGKGIDAGRISAKGYGESQLVNYCRNGISCPDDMHQNNRRTELKILAY